jgi:hypothetical protein
MEMAVVYSWTGPRPGMAKASAAHKAEIDARMAKLQAEGKITDFAWYLASQSGPHMLIIRGSAESLMATTGDMEEMALRMKSAVINEDFTWGMYATGATVDAIMGMFLQAADELGAT